MVVSEFIGQFLSFVSFRGAVHAQVRLASRLDVVLCIVVARGSV